MCWVGPEERMGAPMAGPIEPYINGWNQATRQGLRHNWNKKKHIKLYVRSLTFDVPALRPPSPVFGSYHFHCSFSSIEIDSPKTENAPTLKVMIYRYLGTQLTSNGIL